MRAFLLVSTLVLCSVGATAEADTTIYLVRHAEKAKDAGDGDPALTVQGKKRAARLARILRSAGIEAIYSSKYKRNRQTAQPTAKLLKLTTKIVDPDPKTLAKTLKKGHDNKRVLVVGHSNTVPEIIANLGVKKSLKIEHWDYDDLFIVTLSPKGTRLEHLHYGDDSKP